MYVILTSKPGQFRTEAGPGLRPIESYDYVFHGARKAEFVIAELLHDTKITIVDETPPPCVNSIPSKLLESYGTIEQARGTLNQLATFGRVRARLLRRDLLNRDRECQGGAIVP